MDQMATAYWTGLALFIGLPFIAGVLGFLLLSARLVVNARRPANKKIKSSQGYKIFILILTLPFIVILANVLLILFLELLAYLTGKIS